MSLFNIFEIAGSGMSAQSIRLNTVASNMANADTAGGSVETTYKARQPVFAAMLNDVFKENESGVGVQVLRITESTTPLERKYDPGNPIANSDGYVFMPNVNMIDEMANMISASRSYQSNVEVINTSKQMLLRTLSLGE